MLQVTNVETFNWSAAIRGMRNPKNSWHLSDSRQLQVPRKFVLGEQDLRLCKTLIKAGSDHRKFLRQIFISMDITAPLYWWKEFDTYKVGTVANSCSTMHKLHSKQLTIDDFSFDDVSFDEASSDWPIQFRTMTTNVVRDCEFLRSKFVETGDKRYWKALVQLLPESYNQTRTISMNYEVAMKIYFARRHHKLSEWHVLCDAFEHTLPYFKDFFIQGDDHD